MEEADNHKPGTGAVIREMWQMEESFFKDQAKNETGRQSNKWSSATIRVALAI